MLNKTHVLGLSKALSRKNLYSEIIKASEQVKKGDKVLCIGSAGAITSILRDISAKNQWVMTTVDINSDLRPDLCLDLCKDRLEGQAYDYIFFCEVLEHLYDPFFAIDNLWHALKYEGIIFGSVPFAIPIHEAPHDYYRFTEFGLKYLLRNFNNISVVGRGSYYDAIDALWARTIFSQKDNNSYLVSSILILLAYYIKRPVSCLLSKINPLSSLHIGYVFQAQKPA